MCVNDIHIVAEVAAQMFEMYQKPSPHQMHLAARLEQKMQWSKWDPERCARGNLRTEICARKAAHEECCARNDTHGNLHTKKLAHGKKRTDALSTEY